MSLEQSGISIWGSARINGREWSFQGMQSHKQLHALTRMELRSILPVSGRSGFHFTINLDGFPRAVTFCGKNATERMVAFLQPYA